MSAGLGIAAVRAAEPDAETSMQRRDKHGDEAIDLAEARKGVPKHAERFDVDHDGRTTPVRVAMHQPHRRGRNRDRGVDAGRDAA